MIKSMTGYGYGRSESPYGEVSCEIKTINHRYFELSSRLPSNFIVFEERIKKLIAALIKRGRVNLLITYHPAPGRETKVLVHAERASQVYHKLSRLAKELKIDEKPRLDHILAAEDIIISHPEAVKPEKMWAMVKKALDKALSRTVQSRSAEGRRLYRDLVKRVRLIQQHLRAVEQRAPKVINNYRRRLASNVKEITGKANLKNNERGLVQEIINFTKSVDITEEIIRLKSHLTALAKVLSKKRELGRHLDFVAQEMHREVNTIAAKANDYPISSRSIQIRTEIDKIREQAQNIE